MRLETLERLGILDSPSEAVFDDIVRLASQVCRTPIALVSLVDKDRQWFKARVGLDVSQTPREDSLCAHAIDMPAHLMEVPDTAQDPRFRENPLVTGPPFMRFYAGAPLVTPEGVPLGTLCVIDRVPRTLDDAQKAALEALARQVVQLLVLRLEMTQRHRTERLLRDQTEMLERIAAGAPLPDVLDLLMRGIERHAGGMRAGILLLEPNRRHLRTVSAPSLPPDYSCALDGIEVGMHVGPCSTAAHTRSPVVIADIPNDPRWPSFRKLATDAGLAACWSMPIFSSRGDTLGTFALYYTEKREPTREELELLELAAHLAGVAIEREQAAQTDRRLAAIMRSSGDAILAEDAEGRITAWSPGAQRLLGYDAEEVLGRPMDMLFEQPRDASLVARVHRGESVMDLESDLRDREGRSIPVSLSFSRIEGTSGDDVGITTIARDMRERKMAELALDRARRELAQSEKLAALGSLIAGVAHELRTPLTYASNSISILERRLGRAQDPAADQLRGELAPFMSAAQEGMDRINRLVKDLRRYTRQDPEMRAEVPLDRAVRGALDLFAATQRGVLQVDARLEATPPVDMDLVQIQQVVLNLLQNAADATNHRGPVRIRTRRSAHHAEVVVEDEGVGIPLQVQQQMYEPFVTTKADGTGLGLSIVRRIVEHHGGTISCESAEGGPTRFVLRFPCRSETQPMQVATGASSAV